MAAPDPDEPLVLDRNLCLLIPDHRGEVLAYLWEVAPPGLDDWCVFLRRVDAKAGPYRVCRTPGGRYRCSCQDAIYRSRKEKRPCKHAAAVSKLWGILCRLMPGGESCGSSVSLAAPTARRVPSGSGSASRPTRCC